MLQKLGPGRFYLDYGPVQMAVSAFAGRRPLEEALQKVEVYVQGLLQELTDCLALARQLPREMSLSPSPPVLESLPPVLQEMIGAVSLSGDPDLTPMAAVAGAFADSVADFLVEQGATRVIVNNGGDIALRLEAGEEPVVVGLKPDLAQGGCSHTFQLRAESGLQGIATSGLGGRGFTLGIASAVTVVAGKASVADACATSLANSTNLDHPAIVRLPAEKLDPRTDIRGQLVTVRVAGLEPRAYRQALQAGIGAARQLLERGVIGGVAICAGPYISVLPSSFAAQFCCRESSLPGAVPG